MLTLHYSFMAYYVKLVVVMVRVHVCLIIVVDVVLLLLFFFLSLLYFKLFKGWFHFVTQIENKEKHQSWSIMWLMLPSLSLLIASDSIFHWSIKWHDGTFIIDAFFCMYHDSIHINWYEICLRRWVKVITITFTISLRNRTRGAATHSS